MEQNYVTVTHRIASLARLATAQQQARWALCSTAVSYYF